MSGENTAPAFVVVDDKGVVVGANDAACALAGRALVGVAVDDVVKDSCVGGVVVDVIASDFQGVGQRALILRPVGVRDGEREVVRQMAATVGHGLRNPLGAVRNAWFYVAKRVRDSDVAKSDARVPQFLDIVDVELKRCTQVVADLFDFAELKASVRAPIRLRSVVDAVANDLGVAVDNAVDGDLPLADVDAGQLKQALAALLQNGIDAAGPGARVVVRGGFDGDDLVIDVEDNGPGVADDVRARLFDPHFTTKLKGTGLGLALVDVVARAHGGRASVDNGAAGGAVFRLRLARARVIESVA